MFQHHQLTKLREAINQKYGENLQDYHQVRTMMNIKMPMMKMAKMVMMIIMMPMPIVRMTKMVMMVVENNHDENNVGGNDIMMMIQPEKSIFNIFSFLIFQLHSWSVQNYGQFWQEVNNNIYHHHLQHQSHPKSA